MKFKRAVSLHQEGSLIKNIGTNLWRIDKPFHWWIDYNTKKTRVVVGNGFVTDFGSIPRLLRIFLNPTGYISYILHDKLYSDKSVELDSGEKISITREQADQILNQSLKTEGCPILEADMIYLGCRIGGWYRWYNS